MCKEHQKFIMGTLHSSTVFCLFLLVFYYKLLHRIKDLHKVFCCSVVQLRKERR